MTDIVTIGLSETAETDIPFSIYHLSEAPIWAFTELRRRHTYHLLIWISEGDGANIIDFEEYPLRPGQLHLVAPAQVQYWAVEKPPSGYYLRFTDELFLLSGAESFLSRLDLFETADQQQVLNFAPSEAADISHNLDQMAAEFQQRAIGWIESIVARLQLLLIAAQRQQRRMIPTHEVQAGQLITRQFLKLVQQHAAVEHELSFYANVLGITNGHLSETTKTITGESAARLIRKRLMLEAKRLLVYSELTIAQIAEQLNFADASYFGRFFKRETGQTPRQFRTAFFRHL